MCGFFVVVHCGIWYIGVLVTVFEFGCLFYKGDQVIIEYI